MWVKFYFFVDGHYITAAVVPSSPDRVYFLASDLGRFLGYANPYHFAKYHAKRNLLQLLPENVAKRWKRKILVFTFGEMLHVISNNRSKKCIQFAEYGAREMWALWTEGFVRAAVPDTASFAPIRAPVLLVEHVKQEQKQQQNMYDCGPYLLQDWIDGYAESVSELFAIDFKPCVVEDSVFRDLVQPPTPMDLTREDSLEEPVVQTDRPVEERMVMQMDPDSVMQTTDISVEPVMPADYTMHLEGPGVSLEQLRDIMKREKTSKQIPEKLAEPVPDLEERMMPTVDVEERLTEQNEDVVESVTEPTRDLEEQMVPIEPTGDAVELPRPHQPVDNLFIDPFALNEAPETIFIMIKNVIYTYSKINPSA